MNGVFARSHGGIRGMGVLILSLVLPACASFGGASVGPQDVPDLEARAQREPTNGRVQLELGAALAAAGRCDGAVAAAQRGRDLLPADPAGPLIIGQCLEDAGSYDQALALYAQYLDEHGETDGAAVVRGRRRIALQRQAEALARAALANEANLPEANPATVGVFPFLVDGDSIYQPLSVGMAHMLTTDLALLRRFPLVERVQLEALLQELQLPPELIDPATAARTGRLMRASRMILGTVSVPSEANTTLGGNIVLETGEIVDPTTTQGDLRDLFALEKELALRIAGNLGYQLSGAERQRILENRPASLAAFLAFSRGLMEEDLGNYGLAADQFREAVRADPGYGEARDRLREAVGAEVLSQSVRGDALVVARRVDQQLGAVSPSTLLSSTLAGAVLDLASHQPERATLDAGSAAATVDVLPQDFQAVPVLEAVLHILITIPR